MLALELGIRYLDYSIASDGP